MSKRILLDCAFKNLVFPMLGRKPGLYMETALLLHFPVALDKLRKLHERILTRDKISRIIDPENKDENLA